MNSVLNVKALVGAFNQEKALVGAFSVIVQPVVEPMDRFTALVLTDDTVTRRWAGPCQNVSCLILFSKIVRAAVFEMMDTFSNNPAPCVPLPRYSRQAWARGWSSGQVSNIDLSCNNRVLYL